jgi:hypothetical protein
MPGGGWPFITAKGENSASRLAVVESAAAIPGTWKDQVEDGPGGVIRWDHIVHRRRGWDGRQSGPRQLMARKIENPRNANGPRRRKYRLTWAGASRAGDGNRTRTVSLED